VSYDPANIFTQPILVNGATISFQTVVSKTLTIIGGATNIPTQVFLLAKERYGK